MRRKSLWIGAAALAAAIVVFLAAYLALAPRPAGGGEGEEGGRAAARGTDDTHKIALHHRKGDVLQGGNLSIGGLIALLYMVELNQQKVPPSKDQREARRRLPDIL